jgi:sodium-dependent dicarboxylate transporter 2/3/5
MYGWIACDLVWPSILGLLFLGLSDYSTVNGVFGTIFNDSVMQTLMCFLIAGLLNCFGITDYIAGKLMSAKMIIGHPWRMVSMFFVGAAVLSALSSSVAAIFIMWSIFTKTAEKVGYGKQDRFVAFVIAGIVYSSVLASMVLPFKSTTIAYMNFAKSAIEISVPTIPYIIYMLAFNIIAIALYMIIAKIIFKVDISKFLGNEDHFAYMRGKKATKDEKIGMLFIAGFIIPLLWPGIFPKEWAITQLFSSLGIIGVIAVLLTIGSFLRDEDGNQIAPVSKLMNSVGWDMIFLLAATFPMAAAMRSADCGIMATVNAYIVPMVSGMGATTLILAMTLVLGLVTQVTHNGVLAAMFMPFLIPIFAGLGGNPVVGWFLLYVILQSAYATPAVSMYSGIIFGNEAFKGNNFGYLLGFTMFFVCYALLAISLPVLNMIF